ncbi:MAG: hypothetical protein M1587_05810 [Thaumarchaeota archaeon]|nr:hypothetical protein [Nitrososphaerota archaeon]
MATMLFGLPLLVGYYGFDYEYLLHVLVPYLIVSAVVILFLVINARRMRAYKTAATTKPFELSFPPTYDSNTHKNCTPNVFRRFPNLIILLLAVPTLILFSVLTFISRTSYPFPPPLNVMTPLGEAYIVMLITTSIVISPRILFWAFPILKQILVGRKYALTALVFALFFAVVYLLLVNQIIIAGYNVALTVPASLIGGGYPNALAMTPAAVDQPLLDLVYLPTLLVQPSPQINLILIPFEMVFVTLLSLLVASDVTMAYYLVSSKSALSCSTKGTALSTGGSFLGLTATCPTCLAPTIVSVIFGSVSTATTIFSNFNGVVLPPVISVAILLLSTAYLSRTIKKTRNGTL